MEFGIHDDQKIGCTALVILALLTVIPPATGYIDCRISCRRCHENTEHPSVLEVYCAMCEECKQRRRERMQGRSTTKRTSTSGIVTTLVRMRDGLDESAEALAKSLLSSGTHQAADPHPPPTQAHPPQQPQTPQTAPPQTQPQPQPQPPQPPRSPLQAAAVGMQGHRPPLHGPRLPRLPRLMGPGMRHRIQRDGYDFYEMGWPMGCPTPPVCSESEEEPEKLFFSSTSTTTTTTTTPPPTAPPCPPIPPCKKRRRPMMMPMPMPCMSCMPMCPCPAYTSTNPPNYEKLMLQQSPSPSTNMDYHYLYIGFPKNALRFR